MFFLGQMYEDCDVGDAKDPVKAAIYYRVTLAKAGDDEDLRQKVQKRLDGLGEMAARPLVPKVIEQRPRSFTPSVHNEVVINAPPTAVPEDTSGWMDELTHCEGAAGAKKKPKKKRVNKIVK